MQSASVVKLSTVYLYYTFPYYLINGTIVENVIEHKICVSVLYTTFISSISHFKKEFSEILS